MCASTYRGTHTRAANLGSTSNDCARAAHHSARATDRSARAAHDGAGTNASAHARLGSNYRASRFYWRQVVQ